MTVEERIEKLYQAIRLAKDNSCHVPSGPKGGQFCAGKSWNSGSIRTLRGRKYLMRGPGSELQLMKQYDAFVKKFGSIDFHHWLVTYGKVYREMGKPK